MGLITEISLQIKLSSINTLIIDHFRILTAGLDLA